MTGPPGRPLRAGASVNDIMGGMFAAIGILAALNERTRTGRGQFVKSALFENNMFLVAQHMIQFAVTGKPAAPMPERVSAWAVYDVFQTSDGQQVFVGVVSDTQWRAFCDAFGLQELLADPTLSSNPQRVDARDRFMPLLRDLLSTFTRDEISAICEKARLPFAPITRPEEMFEDPHLKSPGAMIEVTLPDGRTTPVPALPLEMKGRRFGRRLDIPRVGEHSGSIAEDLGYGPADIERLAKAGILGLDRTADTPVEPVEDAASAFKRHTG
jgi:crotonobetainyl-CoA:carnitine CoA-transferase CaiB-like acyl-CoA transferase